MQDPVFDKNFLFVGGSIGNAVLYVKNILTTKCVVRCRCLSSGMDCVYYGLKSCICGKVDDLLSTGSSAGAVVATYKPSDIASKIF